MTRAEKKSSRGENASTHIRGFRTMESRLTALCTKPNVLTNVTKAQELKGLVSATYGPGDVTGRTSLCLLFLCTLPSQSSSPGMVALLPVPKLQAAILTTQLLKREKELGMEESGFPEGHQGTSSRSSTKQQTFTVIALQRNCVPCFKVDRSNARLPTLQSGTWGFWTSG